MFEEAFSGNLFSIIGIILMGWQFYRMVEGRRADTMYVTLGLIFLVLGGGFLPMTNINNVTDTSTNVTNVIDILWCGRVYDSHNNNTLASGCRSTEDAVMQQVINVGLADAQTHVARTYLKYDVWRG
jgi:hypothetical protein